MVKSKYLLFIAGIVWFFAGFNILRIGVLSYVGYVHIINMIISFIIFMIFWMMVFNKLVIKHTLRIKGYENSKQYFWKFFDLKSFFIMIFMITLGISIRVFHLLPDMVIAIFYTGLGTSLFLAGIKFFVNFFIYIQEIGG